MAPPNEPSSPELDAPRRAPDFSWDSSVGWEPRFVFPPGVTGRRRQVSLDYLDLDHLPWDDTRLIVQLLTTHPQLASMALILPHARACEPALHESIARAAPSRLLLRVEGDPTPKEWDCLARLGTADLYLAACPDDGTTIWRCDGDAQLDALALRPALRQRVRGLAVGFGEARHFRTLSTFPRLSMLTVRGPVVRETFAVEAQLALCALPDLAYVDLLDASEPGSDPRLPVACALGLETYESWRLLDGESDWGVPPTPVPESVPCRLRRVMLWSLDEATRAVLSRCEGLTLEVIDAR